MYIRACCDCRSPALQGSPPAQRPVCGLQSGRSGCNSYVCLAAATAEQTVAAPGDFVQVCMYAQVSCTCAVPSAAFHSWPSARHVALLFLLMHHPVTWTSPGLLFSPPPARCITQAPWMMAPSLTAAEAGSPWSSRSATTGSSRASLTSWRACRREGRASSASPQSQHMVRCGKTGREAPAMSSI